jgi:glycosyltransferase involved in cell wall biosynthesis
LDVPAPTRCREDSRAELVARHGLDPKRPWLLTVAMMRAGAKLKSYRVLADALAKLAAMDWHLIVIGHGPARTEIEGWFDSARVTFVGEMAGDALAPYYAASDLYLWPAVEEAYGMAMLEAQAAGLPVIAGRALGVGDIIRDRETGILVRPGNAGAFARAAAGLLVDAEIRCRMGAKAAEVAARMHGLDAAARILDANLKALVA